MLDASEAGGPLYERMGFIDWGEARTMVLTSNMALRPVDKKGREIVDLADVGFDELATYDSERFGGDRSRLLGLLLQDFPRRGRGVLDDGVLVAYGIALDGAVGPVVAESSSALTAILAALAPLRDSDEMVINVPPDSGHLDALLEMGWEQRRTLRHMRLGVATLPGRRDLLAGQVSYGKG